LSTNLQTMYSECLVAPAAVKFAEFRAA